MPQEGYLNISSKLFEIYTLIWTKKRTIIIFEPTVTYYSYKERLNKTIQKAMLNKQINISNHRSNLTLKFL